MTITVAVDCMGGDHGPSVTVPASLDLLAEVSDVCIALVGNRDSIESELAKRRSLNDARIRVVPSTEVVEMDEAPATALRSKKNSSMRVAINLVKSGDANACVSAGNTGALMAISRFVLKTIPGIDRPAIATMLPNLKGGSTLVLDLGANVDSGAENLRQFALMGAMLVAAVTQRDRPSVGLLNVGAEEIKGNEVVKQAAELLRSTALNFAGNVEGDDIFKGTVDVVVCDGFVGNIALKSSEGVVQMISAVLKEEFSRHLGRRLAALCAYPVIRAFRRRMDHRRYNGASLLGLRGIVVKSHGSADAYAFRQALRRALEEVRNRVPERIAERLSMASEPQAPYRSPTAQ